MPRQIVPFTGSLPPCITHEATRLLRRWEAHPRAYLPHTATAWAAPVILIDGHSGAGKTTVTAALVQALRVAGIRGVQVAGPDAWFPGWEGLRDGSLLTEKLLMGLPSPAAGARGVFVWDWAQNRTGAFRVFDPTRPLVLEGCGTLTPKCAAVASLTVWVEAPGGEVERRQRALERDGQMYAPMWRMWAEQEAAHVEDNRPRDLADIIVVNGAR